MTTNEEARCVFCDKIADATDASVQREARRIYSFEPLNPVTRGHRLFIADEHFAFPHHEPTLAGLAFSEAARYAGEQGGAYNLIVNAGDAASQTIPHVHVHYVPRERNDGLKLPWTEQRAAAPDHQAEAAAQVIEDAMDEIMQHPNRGAWLVLRDVAERYRATGADHQAEAGCGCSCHTMPGVFHIAPCCYPPSVTLAGAKGPGPLPTDEDALELEVQDLATIVGNVVIDYEATGPHSQRPITIRDTCADWPMEIAGEVQAAGFRRSVVSTPDVRELIERVRHSAEQAVSDVGAWEEVAELVSIFDRHLGGEA